MPQFLRATPSDPEKIQLLQTEVKSMLDKHAIELVSSCHPKGGYFSRLFLVRKKSGGWRPVIDLSRLNRHVISPHFKMETLDSVRLSLRKHDWAISLDLTDAIPIHRKSRRFLRFYFMGKTYQFRALPFGLAPAPYVFSRTVKAVVKHCRRMGMRLHSYLDDWLQPSRSQVMSLFHRDQLLSTVLSLGFVPNWDKSELVPSQRFSFLGARFCLEEGLIGPSLDRLTRLVTLIQRMLSARSASARQIHSLLGQMESMARLLPDGRAHKRMLQWCIKDRWSQADQPLDFHISLGLWFNKAVIQWLNRDFLFTMVPLCRPQPDLFLFTDARLVGWGAHMGDLSASGLWSAYWQTQHINVLELRAVMLALKSFHQIIPNCHILLSTDNTTVAAYLNKEGGARSRTLSFMATNLLEWCMKRQVSLTAKFVPGKLNVLADSLSRKGQIIHTEWTIHKGTLSQIFQFWEVPHYEVEQSTSGVHFSFSRSTGLGSGCHVSFMGGNDSLCIPSSSTSHEGTSENGERDLFGHPHCTVLGKPSVFPSSAFSSSCPSSQDSHSEGSFDPASFPPSSSEAGDIQPARLAVLQGGLEKAGFSKKSAERVCAAKRSSTQSLYNSRWNTWMDWCLQREMDPIDPTVTSMADFLIFLFEEKKLLPSSIKGYRSAIASTLKHFTSVDFSSHPVLSDVIRSMDLEKPAVSRVVPHWDLALVLDSLKKSPFEPLSSCSLKCLTQKTVFLIALASGRRRSEIHAFSAAPGSVKFSADFSAVELHFFPGFLAKNQLPSVAGVPIEIPALSGSDMNSVLCPVRALRIYMRRTSFFRRNRKRLFISYIKAYDKEICASTISRWIVDTVRFSYEDSGSSSGKICAHELRALSSSFAWLNRVPLDSVLKAGYWHSENSFIRFYLRDMAGINEKMFSLGPVVASQKVINS